MYDVAVIGAGVVGSLTARELAKYKVSVCLLEKENDVAMGASKANSGIIHAGFDASPGTYKAKFNIMGNRLMKPLCSALGVPYQNNGSLVVAFDKDQMQMVKKLYQRGLRNGVKDMELLNAEQVQALEPHLSKAICGGLLAKTGGIVCPYSLTVAACGNAMDNGAKLYREFEVKTIEKTTEENFIIKAVDKREIACRYIVNCAGIYADKVASMVGDNSFSVHPRIGEYMLLDKDTGILCTHTVFRTPTSMGKGILISPTTHGNLILGPTSEDRSDKEDKATSVQGLEKIMRQSFENMPDVPVRQVITSFAGLRAVGDTGDFIVQYSAPHMVTFGGIESPGLTSAPALAKHAVKMLKKIGLHLEKNPEFCGKRKNYARFSSLSQAEKNRIIKENPDYGTVVCRCEGITKGEILDALRVNPPARDLDGVKRRTRSGMGRCQGGFCSPSVVRMISEYTGIPFEQVTKCGKGSEINFHKTK